MSGTLQTAIEELEKGLIDAWNQLDSELSQWQEAARQQLVRAETAEDMLEKSQDQVRVLRGALKPVAEFRIPDKRDLDSGGVQDEMRLMIRKARLALADTEPKP